MCVRVCSAFVDDRVCLLFHTPFGCCHCHTYSVCLFSHRPSFCVWNCDEEWEWHSRLCLRHSHILFLSIMRWVDAYWRWQQQQPKKYPISTNEKYDWQRLLLCFLIECPCSRCSRQIKAKTHRLLKTPENIYIYGLCVYSQFIVAYFLSHTHTHTTRKITSADLYGRTASLCLIDCNSFQNPVLSSRSSFVFPHFDIFCFSLWLPNHLDDSALNLLYIFGMPSIVNCALHGCLYGFSRNEINGMPGNTNKIPI